MSLSEHLEKLRHFHRLTSYRSINEGAQAMGMSQAGLSKSISSLEAALDTKLFHRSKDGFILTKEGQLVLVATRKILDEAFHLETNLRSLKAAETPRKLLIGMYDSIAVYFFSELSSYIKAIYRDVSLELVVNTSSSLANLVSTGRLDIAIGANIDQKTNSKNHFFLLFEDHYGFYCAPDKVSELRTLPFLIHPEASDAKGISNRDQLSNLLKNRSVHEIYNFETIKTMTSTGAGIGVLPTQVAKPLVQKKLLVPVQLPKVTSLFGTHSIGFLTSQKFLQEHQDFIEDIYRLGQRWAQN